MEDSDVEMDTFFDDNIKIEKKENIKKGVFVLKDKTNKKDVLMKYNLDFNYEEDQLTNEINKKYLDDISNKFKIDEENINNQENIINNENFYNQENIIDQENIMNNENINNNENIINIEKINNQENENNENIYIQKNNKNLEKNSISFRNPLDILSNNKNYNLICKDKIRKNNLKMYREISKDKEQITDRSFKLSNNEDIKNNISEEKDCINNGKDIDNKELNIKNNIKEASTSIIYEIQKEFYDLKESHKAMLLLRNRLLVLLDNEVQIIKKEIETKKNEEILKIKEEHLHKENLLRKESLYYKNRYIKFKEYCKEKVFEYKKKLDNFYKNRKNK